MLESVRPEAVLPDRALYLPTFSHFLVVNKNPRSLSLPPSLSLEEEVEALPKGFVRGLFERIVEALLGEVVRAFLQAYHALSLVDEHCVSQTPSCTGIDESMIAAQ